MINKKENKNNKSSFKKHCKKCGDAIPIMISINNICDNCLVHNIKKIRL
jgi:hypothetical protein